jgi:histidinol-phosphate aminotransferase
MKSFDELANPWVKGLGVYEPGRPIEEVARELGFESSDEIVKLASNENALGPSPRAMKAMCAAVGRMHIYPDGGAFYLRTALAKKLGVQADQILVGSGSNEILEFLGHVFLNPNTSIVMADRAFVVYKLISAMFGAQTITVPMRNYTHDLEAMSAAIRPDTRLVFVANPNNPTGTVVDIKALDRFLARLPESAVAVMDEAYIELLPPDQQPDTLQWVRERRKVVVLRTFSKTYGLAGLRVGYAVAPEACIQLMHRVRQPFNVNAMALAAAEAALGDDAFVRRTRRLVAEGLEFFSTAFERLNLQYVPSAANFILVKVGRGREVFQGLEREGVIVRPMDPYGLPEHIRITIGTRAENRRCLRALERVLKARTAIGGKG